MPTWKITFTRHNNTDQLQLQSAQQPSPEEAAEHVLEWATENLKPGEYGTARDAPEGPVGQLLRRYGITVTGIVEESPLPEG